MHFIVCKFKLIRVHIKLKQKSVDVIKKYPYPQPDSPFKLIKHNAEVRSKINKKTQNTLLFNI